VKENPNNVIQNFSNHTRGAYFNSYKEHLNLHILLGDEVDILV